MGQDLVYIAGEYVSTVEDLSNCADLMKRTLDEYFGVGWVAIVINTKQPKSNYIETSKKLSFGANYSLSDKVDMKIIYFDSLYVNIFRLPSQHNMNISSQNEFN